MDGPDSESSLRDGPRDTALASRDQIRRPVPYRLILVWFMATRALALGATHLGAHLMTPEKRAEWTWRPGASDLMPGQPPGALVAPTVRWDANFYITIARTGYPEQHRDRINYFIAFFPLYPLLVRLCERIGMNTFAAAFLISNLASLLAAFAMYWYVLLASGRAQAIRAAMLLLASPGSHFFSYPYPEALFVLLVACAFLLISADRPLGAMIFGGLASATRSAGVVVAFALFVSATREIADQRRARALRYALAALGSLGGLAVFAWWCHTHYGDALAFAHVQDHFGRGLAPWKPLAALLRFDVDPDYYLVTFAAIAVVVAALRRRIDESSSGAALLTVLPMATGTLKAMIRYMSANVPLVKCAADLLAGRWFTFSLGASVSLMVLEAFLFGKGIGHY